MVRRKKAKTYSFYDLLLPKIISSSSTSQIKTPQRRSVVTPQGATKVQNLNLPTTWSTLGGTVLLSVVLSLR